MELLDGQTIEVRGSSGSVYELKNVGGVFSCSCPAWRNQPHPAHQRTCKHLKNLRGHEAEVARIGMDSPAALKPAKEASEGPPLLLAHPWDQVMDLRGWWMSEKLDGVRAYWDGKRLLSRLGNPLVAPSWFTSSLPDHPLDGELWGGRKLFQKTVSIVRRQDGGPQWKDIRYVVFDAPHLAAPFEERIEYLRTWSAPEHCLILEQQPCRDVGHLREELARIEADGGEGLMMRRPGSLYEVGRSWTLLKVKSFLDAEATVVGHQDGKGKHTGRLGALVLELPNGIRFSVGTGFSDAERLNPPPLGSVVTFRYQELSDGGVPRFPTYAGSRIDKVVSSVVKEVPVSMQVLQSGLAEACDLHSLSAGERLGTLLEALRAYSAGDRGALQSYAEKFPNSRVKDALAAAGLPPKPAGGAAAVPAAAAAVAAAPPASAAAAPPAAAAAPPASVAVPAAKSAPAVPPVDGDYRRFEFEEGNSSKFWEVAVDGCNQSVRFGRIGTAGQVKTKVFATEAEAHKDTEKLIAEKLGKGYQEI